MIVRDQPAVWGLFFVLRGSILSRIFPRMVFFALWAVLVEVVAVQTGWMPSMSLAAMGLFGVALTLFLSFRNTVVYDRWWEARRLWGGIVAGVRAGCHETLAHIDAADDRRRVLLPIAHFFHAHRENLRRAPRGPGPCYSPLKMVPQKPAVTNAAAFWLNMAASEVNQLAQAGGIDPMGRLALSNRLAQLAAQQAGNERIKFTPVPFVYSLLVRRTTYVYCTLLPFALAQSAGAFAPAIMAVVAYAFFGLQTVTNDLEDPFASNENALPLDAICRVCDNTILETLNEPPLPPLKPVNYVLT